MAARMSFDTRASLNGIWTLNPTISDSLDPIFKMKGMNYSLRKILKLDSLEVRLALVRNNDSTALISSDGSKNESLSSSGGDQTLSARLPSISQINDGDHFCDKKLVLGQHTYEVWDPYFGLLTCSVRWTDVGQVKDRFLSSGVRKGKLVLEEVVESADVDFFARIIWAFEKGRHMRNMEITTPGATLRRQLFYDFHGNNVAIADE